MSFHLREWVPVGIIGLRMNHLNTDVVVQVHNDGSHQIRGGDIPLSGANQCRAENIFTDNECPIGIKADFPDFVLREL